MQSKLAQWGRQMLFTDVRRLTREERLQAFVRHSKLVIQLSEAARQARQKRRERP